MHALCGPSFLLLCDLGLGRLIVLERRFGKGMSAEDFDLQNPAIH